jgi:tight adherence protein C
MIPPMLIGVAAVLGAVGLVACLVLMTGMRRQRRVTRRLRGTHKSGAPQSDGHADGPLLLEAVAALGSAVARSGILSARTLGELEQTLVSSGLRGRNGIGLFIGSKLLLFAVLPVLAILLGPGAGLSAGAARLVAIVAGIVGLLLPDTVVRRNHKKYLERVDSGVSDALDMLVICAQAGLGLETAMHRVAIEIRLARPEMATELELTLKEMRIAVDTQRGLIALGVRTGLPSLKRVAATLVQTIQYGTPLSEALRVLSAEMRQDTLTKFEARAARLPVLLTMPMIMFIFPCIFIAIAGPAAMKIGAAFGN